MTLRSLFFLMHQKHSVSNVFQKEDSNEQVIFSESKTLRDLYIIFFEQVLLSESIMHSVTSVVRFSKE